MSDSNKALNILAWRAAEDIFRVREGRERANITAITREYGVDRNRVTRRFKSVRSRTS